MTATPVWKKIGTGVKGLFKKLGKRASRSPVECRQTDLSLAVDPKRLAGAADYLRALADALKPRPPANNRYRVLSVK
jgi:hypothetical protein